MRFGSNPSHELAVPGWSVQKLPQVRKWKNGNGKYEARPEWQRVYAWDNPATFAETLQKVQLVSLEGKIEYRAVEKDVEGEPFTAKPE
jgi:single-stranded DNA-binding protein